MEGPVPDCVGPCKGFGFYYECKEKPLEGFEQNGHLEVSQ